MPKPYCLCSGQDKLRHIPANFVSEIEKHFNIVWMEDYVLDPSLYSEQLEAVFSCKGMPKITKDLMDGLSNLKIVAIAGSGYNDVDVQMVRSYGVKVSNTPNILDETVVELSMALILAAGRNLIRCVRLAMAPTTTFFPENDVAPGVFRSTLGIVEMGGIGYKVAVRAKAFGMKVLYNNRSQRTLNEEQQVGATYFSSLNEMLPLCDYVLVATPLTPRTIHLFGSKQFELMKSTATLVNVSRGGAVNQNSLVKALTTGQIRSAAMDVTDPEPLPRDHPLLKLDNVIISPHCGCGTESDRKVMIRNVIANAVAAVEGKPLLSEVFD